MNTHLKVLSVDPGSHADHLGVTVGDVLVSVAGVILQTPSELTAILEICRLPSSVVIFRDGREIRREISHRTLGVFCSAVSSESPVVTAARESERRLSQAEAERATNVASTERARAVKRNETAGMLLTTTDSVPGAVIAEVLGIVSGESDFRIEAGLTDAVFASTGAADMRFSKARKAAQGALVRDARSLGADAVVGVAFGAAGSNKAHRIGVFVVFATGTAVRLHRGAPTSQVALMDR